ncbi:MAG: hypothetical protein NZT92_23810, partial [Abditibacteriales bacterium]|nr:hypothetical protein [Abditibacteriales bacterium]
VWVFFFFFSGWARAPHPIFLFLPRNQNPLTAGVKAVRVLDTQRRAVKVYPGGVTLHEDDALDGGTVLPGFAVPVRRLFRRRKP